MVTDCWQINETGFLINPSPLNSLHGYVPNDVADHLDGLMSQLSDLLSAGQLRTELDDLPINDLADLDDALALERAFQIYTYFASGYVHAPKHEVTHHIPASVAVPLVALANKLERPPILSYAPYTLANWRKIDSNGDITIDNLALLHPFIDKRDAAWFTLIHVDIEARAARGIAEILPVLQAIENDDVDRIIAGLGTICDALQAMMNTLKRMPEFCHPTVYYHEVRPYIMSFTDVVYDGVDAFADKPQSFVGETGAQSSIVPSFVRLLGVSHEETSMTKYLRIMHAYMPKTHHDFIQRIPSDALRDKVNIVNQEPLRSAYNDTLKHLLAFRKMHIRYAASYIANQAPDKIGTGGTEFMLWLQQLIDETEAQFL